MNSNTPKHIGKYRIDALLGQGSMGVVYKAFDVDITRTVALKVLHRHLTDGDSAPEMALRFKQEAQAAARCLHPNIVTIFDYGTAADGQYIAMEYVHGTNLRTMLKYEKKLAGRQAVELMRQVLSALEYAHESGVVHRDIKPANIMLTNQGRVKVTDFGIAKLDTSDLTSAGVVIGTPSYMSPEARRGLPSDAKSDLYSAGLVLYEMLSGIRPQPNQDLIPTLKINLYEMSREQQAIDQIYQVLMRVLADNPQERLGTAREFDMALGQVELPEEDDAGENTLIKTMVNIQKQMPAVLVAGQDGTKPPRTGEISTGTTDRVLRELKTYLGPMSEQVLKRAVLKCTDVDSLIEDLASQIPNASQKQDFLRKVRVPEVLGSSAGTASKSGSSPGAGRDTLQAVTTLESLALQDEKIKEIAKLLARYAGPLASHITKRVSSKARSWDELATQLAQNIPNATERDAFLAQLAKLKP